MAESSLLNEISNLREENSALYAQIKRMEGNWDGLLKQIELVEAHRTKLEREIIRVKSELKAKVQLISAMNVENNELKSVVSTKESSSQETNTELHKKLEELQAMQAEAKEATDKYKQSLRMWKDEKKVLVKHKEDTERKLENCEEELQVYVTDNAKMEKQLKLVCDFIFSIPIFVIRSFRISKIILFVVTYI